MILTNN